MDWICRICQQSDASKWIPISCLAATQQERIDVMFSAVTGLSVEEHDRLPQQVCGECLKRLNRTYGLWKMCQGVKKQKQHLEPRCRICRVLIEAKGHMKWDMDISDLFQQLNGETVEINDISRSWFVCKNCLLEMYAACEFKRKSLRSEASLREKMVFEWERMEVDPFDPEHLVTDPFADAVPDQNVPGKMRCSVCSLKVARQQLDENCKGCMLQFRNYDEIRGEELSLCAEDSRCSSGEMDSAWMEDKSFQEYLNDERDQECLTEDERDQDYVPEDERDQEYLPEEDIKFEADTEEEWQPEETNKPEKAKTPSKKRSTKQKKPKEEVATDYKTEIVVTYECCLRNCRKRYSSEEQLSNHFQTAHARPKPLKGNVCQYCEAKFPDKSALLEHSNRRTEKTMYSCLIDGCGYTRMVKSFIIQHCNQKPHVRSIGAAKTPSSMVESQPFDPDHFDIVGDLDHNTYIVERKAKLCCACFLLFSSEEELAVHCEQHGMAEGQPFLCQICGRGFATSGAYTRHKQLAENHTHYYCRVCEKILWTKLDHMLHTAGVHFPEDLNDRIETVTDGFFTCCGCEQQFETEAQLVDHRREKHGEPRSSNSSSSESEPKCDNCHKIFGTEKELEKHGSHYGSKITYKCKADSCGFTAKSHEAMRRHILADKHQKVARTAVRNADPSEYFCCIKGCEVRCPDYDTLIEHGAEMHASRRKYVAESHKERKYICPICGKGFEQEISMLNHKNGRHIDKYHCHGCEQFVPRAERSLHAQCGENQRVKCEICDKMLVSKIGLKQHIKVVHMNESSKRDKHICNLCGKKVGDLPTHMEKHENKRNWVCKICDARFNHVFLLRNHQVVHTGERNYPCRQGCDKRYKNAGDRDRHEKFVHLGIAPFRCEHCEAGFIRQRDLQLHQRKHTGLKLYNCKLCSAGFDKKSEFDEHCKQCANEDE